MVLPENTELVYARAMTYAQALDAFLSKEESSVTALAQAIGTHQPNVTRYRQGERFPKADMARRIDEATGGEVPFTLWQAEFMSRAGLGEAAQA